MHLHAELLPPPPHSPIQAAHDILHLPLTLYNPTPIAQDHQRGHIGRHHCRTPPELRGANVPPLLGSNRAPERVPLTALHLTGQAPPPFPRRSGATAATNHRRLPALASEPPRTASAPNPDLYRFASASLFSSPTFPSPPGLDLTGNRCALPSPALNPSQGPRLRRTKTSRGQTAKCAYTSK